MFRAVRYMAMALAGFAALVLFGATLVAQGVSRPPDTTSGLQRLTRPVRHLSAAEAIGTPLSVVTGVHELPDGRLLVSDNRERTLWLFNRDLRSAAKLMGPDTYGQASPGSFIPFWGDSVLLANSAEPGFTVIAPDGTIGRSIRWPSGDDLLQVGGGIGSPGQPGYDREDRLVYGGSNYPSGVRDPEMPDSAPVVRLSLSTGRADTVTFVRTAGAHYKVDQNGTRELDQFGKPMLVHDPATFVDDWAVLSDGTVAVVRATDCRLDWFHPDGQHESPPTLPCERKQLTAQDKIDLLARMQQQSPTFAYWVAAETLPDVFPAFPGNRARVDIGDDIWVYRRTGPGGGPLYDVLNNHGAMLDEVELPQRALLAGFGTGVIYLKYADPGGRMHLERVHTPPG